MLVRNHRHLFLKQNIRKDTLISFRIKSSKTIQKGGNQGVLYKSYQKNIGYSRLKHHFYSDYFSKLNIVATIEILASGFAPLKLDACGL
jgi:hypothetical protein